MKNSPRLQKNRSIVKLYVNESLLMSKYFMSRQTRKDWMESILIMLDGMNIYFELSYGYVVRDKSNHVYNSRYKSLLEPEQKKQLEKTKQPEFVTPKSFERPKAIYSNKNWA